MNTMLNPVRLTWDGLYELRFALRQLPVELHAGAADLVAAAARRAGARIAAAYPVSGLKKRRLGGVRLSAGVTVTESTSSYGAYAVVRSRAKHANLWEDGTKVRQTTRGANRGAMLPRTYGAPVFVPVVTEERNRMHAQLIELLRHAGVELLVEIAA